MTWAIDIFHNSVVWARSRPGLLVSRISFAGLLNWPAAATQTPGAAQREERGGRREAARRLGSVKGDNWIWQKGSEVCVSIARRLYLPEPVLGPVGRRPGDVYVAKNNNNNKSRSIVSTNMKAINANLSLAIIPRLHHYCDCGGTSEFKSEDLGFDPLAGNGKGQDVFFLALRVNFCADLFVSDPPSGVWDAHTKMCTHVKYPISTCRKRESRPS